MNKLILGTVQLGLNYGINNLVGKPNEQSVENILTFSYKTGILTLDTADAYGNASDLIGVFHQGGKSKFNIITKFKDIENAYLLNKWLDITLKKLQIDKFFCCMFHSFDDYVNKPRLVDYLSPFVRKGIVQNIGVSTYTNQQLDEVISDDKIHLVQLPYNLLDNHSIRGDLIQKAKQKGKIIHVRSVFLQGLFFMNLDNLPKKLASLKPNLEQLHQLCKKYEIPMQTLALNYVNSNPNIDGIIIGVDNLEQLQANIQALKTTIPIELIAEIDNIVIQQPELLNPVNWS